MWDLWRNGSAFDSRSKGMIINCVKVISVLTLINRLPVQIGPGSFFFCPSQIYFASINPNNNELFTHITRTKVLKGKYFGYIQCLGVLRA